MDEPPRREPNNATTSATITGNRTRTKLNPELAGVELGLGFGLWLTAVLVTDPGQFSVSVSFCRSRASALRGRGAVADVVIADSVTAVVETVAVAVVAAEVVATGLVVNNVDASPLAVPPNSFSSCCCCCCFCCCCWFWICCSGCRCRCGESARGVSCLLCSARKSSCSDLIIRLSMLTVGVGMGVLFSLAPVAVSRIMFAVELTEHGVAVHEELSDSLSLRKSSTLQSTAILTSPTA